jgi:hypothetical protein
MYAELVKLLKKKKKLCTIYTIVRIVVLYTEEKDSEGHI